MEAEEAGDLLRDLGISGAVILIFFVAYICFSSDNFSIFAL